MAYKSSLLLLNKINLLLLALIYHQKKHIKQQRKQRKRKVCVWKLFTERRAEEEINFIVKDLKLVECGSSSCCIIYCR